MGFALNPTYAEPENLPLNSKKRVWEIFSELGDFSSSNRLGSKCLRGKNVSTATKLASGRTVWLSRDPIAENGGINLYQYVSNNPINAIDPLGLFESHPLLRLLVPGQVAFDDAVTALENGEGLEGLQNLQLMIAEQVLTVATAGTVKVPRMCPTKSTTTSGFTKEEADMIREAIESGGAGTKIAENPVANVLREIMAKKGKSDAEIAGLLNRLPNQSGIVTPAQRAEVARQARRRN